jgi:hypothetical protein
MIGYASRPHQPLHEESASAKLFPAPWTRLFMCVHTPSRVGAEWRGAHVGMQPHAHRIRSRRARWTVLLLFLFLHKYTLFTRINKKKPGHPTYDIKSYTAHGPWCMEHGLTHTHKVIGVPYAPPRSSQLRPPVCSDDQSEAARVSLTPSVRARSVLRRLGARCVWGSVTVMWSWSRHRPQARE